MLPRGAKHRGVWPVSWMCDTLGVSRSGFHAWLTRPQSARARRDEALGAVVRASFARSDRTYGARRVHCPAGHCIAMSREGGMMSSQKALTAACMASNV